MSLIVKEGEEEEASSSSGEDLEALEENRKRIEEVKMTKITIQEPYEPIKAILTDIQIGEVPKPIAIEDPMAQMFEIAERGFVNSRVEDRKVRPTISQYQIRPSLENKFKAGPVKEMIHGVMNDQLGGKEYSLGKAEMWTKSIANTVRAKVRDMGYARYKFIVQCVLGEEHGAGVKIGARCLWDADCDNYASDIFLSDTIFCMTAVYAIYYY